MTAAFRGSGCLFVRAGMPPLGKDQPLPARRAWRPSMVDEKQSRPLAAIEFTPLDAAGARRKIRVSPVYLGLGVVLAFAVLVFAYLLAARAVIFNLDPGHATINVSGLSFHIGGNFLLLPGQHQVSVEADGYHALSTTIEVTGARTQEVELVLDPLPGKLKAKLRAGRH